MYGIGKASAYRAIYLLAWAGEPWEVLDGVAEHLGVSVDDVLGEWRPSGNGEDYPLFRGCDMEGTGKGR